MELFASFGEMNRALSYFDEPAGAVSRRIWELHRRHGETVSTVMKGALSAMLDPRNSEALSPDCLLRQAGADVFGAPPRREGEAVPRGPASLPPTSESGRSAAELVERFEVRISGDDTVEIVGLGKLDGATAAVLIALAHTYLDAAGQGLAPADYPLTRGAALARMWGLEGDEAVRRRISRARAMLSGRRMAAGGDTLGPNDIIESVGWKGYRLNPWQTRVVLGG